MNFPKNIFQTWKNKNVPEKWKLAQQSVIAKNQNWKYVFLTDDDNDTIVKTYFPDFYQTFINYKYPIQRADAIRYCVLYLYGGIYLDLDYMCNKSFDDITLNREIGLTLSGNTKNIFTNSVLISQKGSQFWLLVLQEMQKSIPKYKKISKHLEIMNTTGPLMLNRVAHKHITYIETFTNLQVPCNSCVKICDVDNNYYLTPIEGKSWNSWDSNLLNFIMCNKEIIILIIILFITLFYKKKIK